MEKEKDKLSFGEILAMALAASLAISTLFTLKLGGALQTGFIVALAAVFGSGVYRLFFIKFDAINVLKILCSASFITVFLVLGESRHGSVVPDHPTPEPTQAPVSAGDSLAEMMSKFNEKQAELVQIPKKTSPVKNPYLKKKAVFYSKGINFGETDARWIFDSSLAGISDLIAEDPQEVKTVVLKVCRQVKSETPYFIDLNKDGKKEKEIAVFYWTCDVTIIDRTVSAVIFQKTFDSKPFNSLVFDYDSTDKYEIPMPNFTIEAFLKKLPVK